MGTEVIRNVRPLGAAAVMVLDRATGGDRACRSAPAQLPLLIDGGGQLLLPALVESHVHFDKTLWGMPWRPNTAGPTRNDRIANEQRLLPGIDVPIAERAEPDQALHRAGRSFPQSRGRTDRFGIRRGAMLACARCTGT
jgi:cytosine deaminase